jgi:hypothetical protein
MHTTYTEFCESLDITDEEERWLKRQLKHVMVVDGKEIVVKRNDARNGAKPSWRGYKFLREYGNESGVEFEYDIEGHPDKRLTIYAYDGNPEHAAYLMHKFLKRFRPQGRLVVRYSYGTEPLLGGRFGGGAYLVTANGITHIDTSSVCKDFLLDDIPY